MKFLDYYLSSGVRVISLFFGAVAGLLVGLFTDWKIGTLAGAGVTILSSVVLPIVLYCEDRPYAKIKETIKASFLIDERVRFTVKDGTVGGYFLLTDDSMIFLSLEKGDHRLELSRDEVTSVILGDNMTMSIFLNNRQYIRVISGVCEEMYGILREHDWRVG